MSATPGGTRSSLLLPSSTNRPRSDRLVFSAFGVPIHVRTIDPQIIPRLIKHLPPGSQSTSVAPRARYTLHISDSTCLPKNTGHRKHAAERRASAPSRNTHDAHQLRFGRKTLIRTSRLTEVLQVLESDLRLQVAGMSEEKLFVHAGVVGWKGRAILVPGVSGAGKTMLVAALVRAGASYYSDEYAVLDQDGLVHPYATPLRIRNGPQTKRTQRQHGDLGGIRGRELLRVGLVVVSKYSHGAGWKPRVLSPGRAILTLIDNTVSVRRQPQLTLSTLRLVVSDALVLESFRGEAEALPQLLFRELEKHKQKVAQC